ncbi:hypothetical protein [Sodalis-like endosymbiont of Proechinophthirus fluctus]|uniref:hypothetical protein n=1 Tax=Sodalis-like endosymbiont of Proechinophthirus fluctus TaxID=1462730 RepID=UPI00165086C0|nr:hypothetical protein [Sodalis-like endosymbiont of Proechinophthirus fluctus]
MSGSLPFSEADHDYAARFQQTLSQNDLKSAYDRYDLLVDYPRPPCDFVLPLRRVPIATWYGRLELCEQCEFVGGADRAGLWRHLHHRHAGATRGSWSLREKP